MKKSAKLQISLELNVSIWKIYSEKNHPQIVEGDYKQQKKTQFIKLG